MVINIMNASFVLEMFDIEHRLFGCEQLDISWIPIIWMNNGVATPLPSLLFQPVADPT
jgi:hypothetical protein